METIESAFLRELLSLGGTGLLIGFVAWVWWHERNERREVQSKRDRDMEIQHQTEKEWLLAITGLNDALEELAEHIEDIQSALRGRQSGN